MIRETAMVSRSGSMDPDMREIGAMEKLMDAVLSTMLMEMSTKANG